MKKTLKLLTQTLPILFILSACANDPANPSASQSSAGTAPLPNPFVLESAKTGNVVLKINDTEIHEGFFNTISTFNPRIKSQLDNPLQKQNILKSLTDQQLLFEEAVKLGLHNDPKVQFKIQFQTQSIIATSLIEQKLEAAMKEEYEKRKTADFTKVSYSQIVVSFLSAEDRRAGKKADATSKAKALDKAKAIKARLATGEDFAKVAKEVSDDKRTSENGGAAGEISKNDRRLAKFGMAKIGEAAFKLKKDGVSEPIETPNGIVIIKVTSDPKIASFDEAKRTLGFELQGKIRSELVEKLRQSAKIENLAPQPKPSK